MKYAVIFFGLITLTIQTLTAQRIQSLDFEEDSWNIAAKEHKFVEHNGKKALYLNSGRARHKEVTFKNGIIDYHVNFDNKRNFVGFHFRIADDLNYEEYYLRPHQSGNPDAMQYTPVFNGNAGWQLYHGEGYGVPLTFNFNEWMHIRLVIKNQQMEVFIENMDEPILFAHDLKRKIINGALGIGTFLGDAYFADIQVQHMENPSFVSKPHESEPLEQTVIEKWKVSRAFSEKNLENLTTLPAIENSFGSLNSEASGTVNLSQISRVTDSTNTILAKFSLAADVKKTVGLNFGYSDKIRVYLNGNLLYMGDNGYRSRDYRYLGTIGYFDKVYLTLEPGNNEIVMAVTERFGGWGV